MQGAFRHAAVEKTSVTNFEQGLPITISTLGVELANAFARPLDAPMQNDPRYGR
jgi:hypothetical protein